MRKNVKARFTNGAFVPVEEVGLEEGVELIISFDESHLLSLEEKLEILRSVSGAWKGKP